MSWGPRSAFGRTVRGGVQAGGGAQRRPQPERTPPVAALTPLCLDPRPVLAREGYSTIAAAGGVAVLLLAVGLLFGGAAWVLGGVGLVLLAFVVWVFRDPLRTPPEEAEGLLLAPADGEVVDLATEEEPLYLKGASQRISIAPSPLNVHVTRSPVAGVVEYERCAPTDSVVPRRRGAAERGAVGIRHASGTKVLVTQVASGPGRRMVYDAPVGKKLAAGERYGSLKLGARMDIVVPPHVELDVHLGQRTVAGETVLGRIPGPPEGRTAQDPALAEGTRAPEGTSARVS